MHLPEGAFSFVNYSVVSKGERRPGADDKAYVLFFPHQPRATKEGVGSTNWEGSTQDSKMKEKNKWRLHFLTQYYAQQ